MGYRHFRERWGPDRPRKVVGLSDARLPGITIMSKGLHLNQKFPNRH